MDIQEETSEKIEITPDSILEFVGFTLFLLWAFLSLFLAPGYFYAFEDSFWSSLLVICGLLGVVVALAFCGLSADKDAAIPHVRLALISSVITLCMIIPLLFATQIPIVIILVMCFVLGAVGGYALVRWMTLLSLFATPLTTILFVLATILATLFGYLISTVPLTISVIAVPIALAASLLLAGYLTKKKPPAAVIKKGETRQRRPMRWKTHVMFDSFGLVFGVSLFIFPQFDAFLIIPIAIILGAICAMVDIRKSGGVYPDRMKKIVVVGSIALLLVFPMVNEAVQIACWGLSFALMAYFFTIQMNWTIYSSHRFQLNVSSFLPEGQTHIWACLIVGYAAGWLFQTFGWESAILSGVLVFLLVVSLALFTPIDLEGLTLLVFKEFDKNESSFSGPDDKKRAKRFVNRCNKIAQAHDLTPREIEVMIFLARGRNAQHISDTMVVSRHTTKTHIYHIYRKLGINSQQELMDLVEGKD